MNKFKQSMREHEAKQMKDVLLLVSGNLKSASEILGMPKSTFSTALRRKHPKLLDYARSLRARQGNERGRPRNTDPAHNKKSVGTAWRRSKHCIAVAARDLSIPASTLRDLLIRYDLPVKKKGGKQ